MRSSKYSKKINLVGLFLLTAFLSLYLVQLACNLPHLSKRLQHAASAQVLHHSAGLSDNSHTHARKTSASKHHSTEQAHHDDEHPASSTENDGCCEERHYSPFLKASHAVEIKSLLKSPFVLLVSICHNILPFEYKSDVIAVSHAPPDAPVPKILDIRVFLHSLNI